MHLLSFTYSKFKLLHPMSDYMSEELMQSRKTTLQQVALLVYLTFVFHQNTNHPSQKSGDDLKALQY